MGTGVIVGADVGVVKDGTQKEGRSVRRASVDEADAGERL